MRRLDRRTVLDFYEQFPFEKHPLWLGIVRHELTKDEIIRAECQHYIRSDIGRAFRKRAAEESAAVSSRAHSLLMETYKEECTEDESGPSHFELIKRFLLSAGITQGELDRLKPTPGNAAAIALYGDISARGPLHHMIGAGAVEYYYSQLSPRVFEAYTSHYDISESQAETYRIHGPMDREHAERALQILDEAPVQDHKEEILLAVRDAFVATCLHYDGMLQAATRTTNFWNYR